MTSSNLKSPYKQVSRLGSAHNGTLHFWNQRLSAVALIILGGWFVYALFAQVPADYYSVLKWVKHPFNTFALFALISVMVFHTQLGLQIIIEDYVHGHGARVVSIGLLKILSFVLVAVTLVFLIRIQIIDIPTIHASLMSVTFQGYA